MPKSKLNQVIAVTASKKDKTNTAITDLHQKSQKEALYEGLIRTYHPDDAEGEKFPDERKDIVLRSADVLKSVQGEWRELWDLIATQEFGNTVAKADIVVDGTAVVKDVPVGYMLFLEKQFDYVYKFVSALPTLDPAEQWEKDANANAYRSKFPKKSSKTAKDKKVVVKYDATEKHPAQTEIFDIDRKVGEWTATRFSGAISAEDKLRLMEKARKMREAVQVAREEANSTPVEHKEVADALLKAVFG